MGIELQRRDADSPEHARSYQFGPYLLDPAEHRLTRDEVALPLTPKVFELLLVLVEAHGRLLTREQLMQMVWPDSFVEESNLTVNISLLSSRLLAVELTMPSLFHRGIDRRRIIVSS